MMIRIDPVRKSRLAKRRRVVREVLEWDRLLLWILPRTSTKLAMWPPKQSVDWVTFLVKDWGDWAANLVGRPPGSNFFFNEITRIIESWAKWKASAASDYPSRSPLIIPTLPLHNPSTQHLSLRHIVDHLNDQSRYPYILCEEMPDY